MQNYISFENRIENIFIVQCEITERVNFSINFERFSFKNYYIASVILELGFLF